MHTYQLTLTLSVWHLFWFIRFLLFECVFSICLPRLECYDLSIVKLLTPQQLCFFFYICHGHSLCKCTRTISLTMFDVKVLDGFFNLECKIQKQKQEFPRQVVKFRCNITSLTTAVKFFNLLNMHGQLNENIKKKILAFFSFIVEE